MIELYNKNRSLPDELEITANTLGKLIIVNFNKFWLLKYQELSNGRSIGIG